MNIFAKQLCSHFSYTAAFRSAHAYCCNSNSLITAAINLICLKFLFFYFIFFSDKHQHLNIMLMLYYTHIKIICLDILYFL